MPVEIEDYPDFRVKTSVLPAIKEWKVGGKYKITLEVEQLDMSKDSGGFKILSAKDATEVSIEDQSQKQFKKTTEKALGSNYGQ